MIVVLVNAELLSITVWFGRNYPSGEMYEKANEQLARFAVTVAPTYKRTRARSRTDTRTGDGCAVQRMSR
jgi:hypothetical protein